MANDYDTTARAIGVDAIAALGTRWALHTADPGGANSATAEVTGGSPAYARKAVAWNAANASVIATGGGVTSVTVATGRTADMAATGAGVASLSVLAARQLAAAMTGGGVVTIVGISEVRPGLAAQMRLSSAVVGWTVGSVSDAPVITSARAIP